jgi:hypothetical protein
MLDREEFIKDGKSVEQIIRDGISVGANDLKKVINRRIIADIVSGFPQNAKMPRAGDNKIPTEPVK